WPRRAADMYSRTIRDRRWHAIFCRRSREKQGLPDKKGDGARDVLRATPPGGVPPFTRVFHTSPDPSGHLIWPHVLDGSLHGIHRQKNGTGSRCPGHRIRRRSCLSVALGSNVVLSFSRCMRLLPATGRANTTVAEDFAVTFAEPRSAKG